jgi:hypothetical protein
MPFSHEPFKPVVTACPFLPQPCIAGDVQGFECRRVAVQNGEVDALVRFRDDAVIYCTVCQKEIAVSSIPRFVTRPDKT